MEINVRRDTANEGPRHDPPAEEPADPRMLKKAIGALGIRESEILKSCMCAPDGSSLPAGSKGGGVKIVTKDGQKAAYFPGGRDGANQRYHCVVCELQQLRRNDTKTKNHLDARWVLGRMAWESLCSRHSLPSLRKRRVKISDMLNLRDFEMARIQREARRGMVDIDSL